MQRITLSTSAKDFRPRGSATNLPTAFAVRPPSVATASDLQTAYKQSEKKRGRVPRDELWPVSNEVTIKERPREQTVPAQIAPFGYYPGTYYDASMYMAYYEPNYLQYYGPPSFLQPGTGGPARQEYGK